MDWASWVYIKSPGQWGDEGACMEGGPGPGGKGKIIKSGSHRTGQKESERKHGHSHLCLGAWEEKCGWYKVPFFL